MQEIKCIGNRILIIEKIGENIGINIYWKDKKLATPVLTKDEALKLVGELNGLIRFNTGT